MTERVVVLYHDDLDGVCSAAIVRRAHLLERYELEFYPLSYGGAFPPVALEGASKVFLVDFSLQPFDLMISFKRQLDDLGVPLIWIDHHKTAIDEAVARGFLTQGLLQADGVSACELTWQYLFPQKILPSAVYHIGRFDVWDHKSPLTLPLHYAFESMDLEPEDADWRYLFNASQDALECEYLPLGYSVMRYEKKLNDEQARQSCFQLFFEKLNCIAGNLTGRGSLRFSSVRDGFDAALSFNLLKNGQWTVSMYALKPEVDVASICKKYGGGGHKGAGGFQCYTLPFDFVEAISDHTHD